MLIDELRNDENVSSLIRRSAYASAILSSTINALMLESLLPFLVLVDLTQQKQAHALSSHPTMYDSF